MKSLTQLLLSVLDESGALCGVNTLQDSKTILQRVEHEGLSFLTITLPSFGKDLERALDLGYVSDSLFASFKRKKGEILPIFLGGFLQIVFSEEDGRLLDMAEFQEGTNAIRSLRQISGLLSRVEIECAPKRVDAALNRYIENESYVRLMDATRSPEKETEFLRMTHYLFSDVLRKVSNDLEADEIWPVHGPGAVADKLRGNSKWIPSYSWPDRLETVFPRWRYAYSSGSNYLEDILSGKDVPGTEMPVTVITVPKTLKTPRIIAIEPTAMQYMQQGLLRSIFDAVNSVPRIARVMSWRSQLHNQQLAYQGSLPTVNPEDKTDLATLDLSDASDLVSNKLVQLMTRNYPLVREALDATRSRRASVLGQEINLAKFASMGSAVCFPIEAMVFTVIVFLGLADAYPTVHPSKLLKKFRGKVRVYGDDIVVPVRAAQAVVRRLEAYGLRVNRSKSFWTGMFRESCGKEFFAGADVTIVKCRSEFPNLQQTRSERVSAIVSTSELRNLLFQRGYYKTAEWLDDMLVPILKGYYPYVHPNSPAIGRLGFDFNYQVDRTDRHLQVPQVRAYVVDGVSPNSRLDGVGALMKTLGSRSELPNPDPRHLERAGRPSVLRMKLKWVSPR